MKVNIQSISSGSRWLKCTASLLYNKTFNENESTIRGNLIHEVSALRLKEIFNGENHQEEITRLKTNDYIDEKDPTLKTKWDNECTKISDEYIDYAITIYNKYKPHTIEIEKKVNLTWYGYENIGFIDLVMVSDEYVIIIDLKTGKTEVSSEDNVPMLMYSVAMIQELRRAKKEFYGNYIISICQPLSKQSTCAYEYSLNQVARFYQSHMGAMKEIISGNLQYRPEKNVCKYCDHRAECNERIKKGVI